MVTAKVITVSDRSYRGEREDAGGPAVKALLERAGYTVGEIVLVPDERERIEKEPGLPEIAGVYLREL